MNNEPSVPHALLDAVVAIGSDLDLPTVLHRIVETATQLADARYGALGIIGEGDFLSEFLTVGVDAEIAERIGPLPHGRGILGQLIEAPEALRLHDLKDHPASFGFPANHPPMRSFLGVPVRIRDTVFGNLYLTEKRGGGDFDAEDERIVIALATGAGVAIDKARLYEDGRRRELWLKASSEVTTALLSGTEPDEVLHLIAVRARELADADFAAIVLPLGDQLVVEVADGDAAASVVGVRVDPTASLIGDAYAGATTHPAGDLRDDPRWPHNSDVLTDFGPAILVPLVAGTVRLGVLWVANRVGGQRFGAAQQSMLEAFADQAALSLELTRQRRQAEQLSLFRDRDRIGRDLHDTVIQRLFATGMQLESSMRYLADNEAAERVQAAVLDLDQTIREIRSTIYALHESDRATSNSLRARVVELIEELSAALGFTPALRLDGLIDTRISKRIAENILPVLRETLSNTARHAHAGRAEVWIRVDHDSVTLTISDDGVGLPRSGRRSGLGNLEVRAHELGGTFTSRSGPDGGTELVWRVPLGDD